MLRVKTINNTLSFIELLLFTRQIVTTFICIVLICLFAGIAMAEHTPIKIGNPLLARFPTSGDPENSRARSIWDMHYFNNRIYIGHGDYWANSGPTDVWIYNDTSFVKEYTVDDEMIFDFFEFENNLFIPGNDATEDWSFENLYINDPNRYPNPGWIKLRTMPGGLHSFDVALFNGKIYASITTDGSTPSRALVSADTGQTWTTFISEYCSFVVFDDFMFIDGDNYYKYDGTTLQTVTPNLFVSMGRKARFQDGVLYANPTRYMLENTPLYFLPANQIKNGGIANNVAKFANNKVRDIVVRGITCYVMTAQEITKDVAYKGRIYSSTDLTNWLLVTAFTVPGIPLSFEIMNNKFYIGLGSRYEPSLGWVCVGPESGSIWEIVAAPTADFIADTSYGDVPLSVQFTDSSSGLITDWDWNFGDGEISNEQNPVHTYESADTFTVSLTVTGPNGSNTKIREKYIVVSEPTGVKSNCDVLPTEYKLHSNYPNPFNPITYITFSLPEKSIVNISIYDINGRLVRNILKQDMQPGHHETIWDAKNKPSGNYFIKLIANDFQETLKCILLK